MTSKIKDELNTPSFPKLMQGKSTGNVYLMHNETEGVVVLMGYGMVGKVGVKFCNTLGILTDFHGTIELTQE